MSGTIVCVADTGPNFRAQVERWFACLTRLAGVEPRDLLTVFVGASSPPDWARPLCRVGMRVEVATAFDPRSPHCNKIEGLRRALRGGAGSVVLSDCDVAFLEDPRGFPHRGNAISAKPVDRANPPTQILNSILQEAGLPTPRKVRLGARPWRRSYEGNANGGVLVFGARIAPALAERWAWRARWLLDRSALLKEWMIHVDQVSLLLAIIDERAQVVRLSEKHNCPTHLRGGFIPAPPAALHYHGRVDENGALLPCGNRAIDRQIVAVNRAFQEARAAGN